PIHCYREALKHLPADVVTYSSAHDDIERALQSAIAGERKKGDPTGPNTPVPPQTEETAHTTTTTAADAGHGADTVTTPGEPGRTPPPGLPSAVGGSSSSPSLPVPLLVLGGLAILLLAGGAVGLIVKQLQNRHRPL